MKKKITAIALVVAILAVGIIGGTLAYFTDTTQSEVNTFTVGKVDINLTEPEWKENEDHTLMPGHVFAKDPTITLAKKGDAFQSEADSQDAYVFLEMKINKYNSLLWVMAADASADKAINFTIYNEDGSIKSEFLNDKTPAQFSTSKFAAYLAQPENNALLNQIVGKWFKGIDPTKWAVKFYDMGTVNKNLLTVRLAYIGDDDILSAGEPVTFMTGFGMPASVTQEMINAGHTVGGQGSTFNTLAKEFEMTFTAYAVQADQVDGVDAAYDILFK